MVVIRKKTVDMSLFLKMALFRKRAVDMKLAVFSVADPDPGLGPF